MKRLLICGGVDGDDEGLALLKRAVEQRRPDGILFVGGILRPTEGQTGVVGRRDLTQEEAQFYARFFETLGESGTFAAVVPGGHDVPLREFLRLGMGAEVQCPKIHLAHATLVTGSDLAICGVGGHLTDWVDTGEHLVRVSRSTAEYSLRPLWRAEQPRKILLLGTAPKGPLGGTGEPGAIAGELIDSYHPDLCAVAGTSEHRGTERIAHTTVINPGRLADGSAAWVDWRRTKDEQVALIDLAAVPATEC